MAAASQHAAAAAVEMVRGAATHSTQDQPTQKILAPVQSPRIFHEKSESKIV